MLKTFDQFEAETRGSLENLFTQDDVVVKDAGEHTQNEANPHSMVFKLSRKYMDARLRAYHEWLTGQLREYLPQSAQKVLETDD